MKNGVATYKPDDIVLGERLRPEILPLDHIVIELAMYREKIVEMLDEIGKIVFGKAMREVAMKELMIILAQEHCLLEGPPGTAKTLLCLATAHVYDAKVNIQQFTIDMMPSKIKGYVQSFITGESVRRIYVRGFVESGANLLYCDEINRSPGRVLASLLEIMQEKKIREEEFAFPIASPFTVIGTMNAIETEETFRIPEAHLDRFTMRISVPYPEPAVIQKIFADHAIATHRGDKLLTIKKAILKPVDVIRIGQLLDQYHLKAERPAGFEVWGATLYAEKIYAWFKESYERSHRGEDKQRLYKNALSPRAISQWQLLARMLAFLQPDKRYGMHVLPAHLITLAHECFAHRLLFNREYVPPIPDMVEERARQSLMQCMQELHTNMGKELDTKQRGGNAFWMPQQKVEFSI